MSIVFVDLPGARDCPSASVRFDEIEAVIEEHGRPNLCNVVTRSGQRYLVGRGRHETLEIIGKAWAQAQAWAQAPREVPSG